MKWLRDFGDMLRDRRREVEQRQEHEYPWPSPGEDPTPDAGEQGPDHIRRSEDG